MVTLKVLAALAMLMELVDGESLRFSFCAEQGFDSSCGLSVLSSLMVLYWRIPAEESELAGAIAPRGAAGVDYTISFADMGALLGARGFFWKAFLMDADQLERAAADYAPLILHYDQPAGHFVLLLGTIDRRFLIADPAGGTCLIGRKFLLERWSGYTLAAIHPGSTKNQALLDQAMVAAARRMGILASQARTLSLAGRPWR